MIVSGLLSVFATGSFAQTPELSARNIAVRTHIYKNVERSGNHQFWAQAEDHCESSWEGPPGKLSEEEQAMDYRALVATIPATWSVTVEETVSGTIYRVPGQSARCSRVEAPSLFDETVPAGTYARRANVIEAVDPDIVFNEPKRDRAPIVVEPPGAPLTEVLGNSTRGTVSAMLVGPYLSIRVDHPLPEPPKRPETQEELDADEAETIRKWAELCEQDPKWCIEDVW